MGSCKRVSGVMGVAMVECLMRVSIGNCLRILPIIRASNNNFEDDYYYLLCNIVL